MDANIEARVESDRDIELFRVARNCARRVLIAQVDAQTWDRISGIVRPVTEKVCR